jgi:endonuclease YncB( thermonuclease family)
VADGDTITVLDATKKQHKIRFYGIDTPETAQAFGAKAKQFTSSLCFGKQVSVDIRDTDRYGRTVGVVMVDGGDAVNSALVGAGLAWWYERYAKNDKELERLEKNARSAKLGLWADKNPVPPWEFRKNPKASMGSKSPADVAGVYWLTASSNKRHNAACRYFKKTNGRACKQADGVACKVCGG